MTCLGSLKQSILCTANSLMINEIPDPDYLEFLEMLGKPTEFLPSAEVQLERREAEKAAAIGWSLTVFFLKLLNARRLLIFPSLFLRLRIKTVCHGQVF